MGQPSPHALASLRVLSNLDLGFAYKADDAAIVPLRDPRGDELKGLHPNPAESSSRFRGAHGGVVQPAVILFSYDDGEARLTEEAALLARTVFDPDAD